MSSILLPVHLLKFIEENKELMKPPVSNKMIYNGEFSVMVVNGPNKRTDYHVNPGEEIFYQTKGTIMVKIIENGDKFRDILIKEGELFVLPASVPHSPQRPKDTSGLVIERRRLENETDGCQWYCQKCFKLICDVKFHVKDLGTELIPVLNKYESSVEMRTCKACGNINALPQEPKSMN